MKRITIRNGSGLPVRDVMTPASIRFDNDTLIVVDDYGSQFKYDLKKLPAGYTIEVRF